MPASVAKLIRRLQSQKAFVRVRAAQALRGVDEARAVDALLAALRDDRDIWVRKFAVDAVAGSSDARVSEALVAELDDPDLRRSAILVLGKRRYVPAIGRLEQELYGDDRETQEFATRALMDIGHPDAERALIEALYGWNIEVIVAAGRLFIAKGIPDTEQLLIEGLVHCGTPRMAAYFVYSGNQKLAEAGRQWLEHFSHPLFPEEPDSPKWGS